MKRCPACGQEKLLEEFNRMRRNRDGRQSRCRLCQRAQVRESTRRHPERAAAKTARWKEKNREKGYAVAAVRWAVIKGRMVKAEVCEDCGARVPLHGHHEDHSKVYDVVWLCPPCHRIRHGHQTREAA